MRRGTEVYSIFGQIESVAAEILIEKGKARKIEARDIPVSAAFDDNGRRASFAVIVPNEHVPEFERLIADLRA